ncbi:MAG: hypothetical protein JWM11_3297, partial [Planctomycetaceae bacterium]|nr:hypothetical protein [Planctomycetaceae bacterium]
MASLGRRSDGFARHNFRFIQAILDSLPTELVCMSQASKRALGTGRKNKFQKARTSIPHKP